MSHNGPEPREPRIFGFPELPADLEAVEDAEHYRWERHRTSTGKLTVRFKNQGETLTWDTLIRNYGPLKEVAPRGSA